MRDRDVREVLRSRLREQHEGEPDTLVVEEMGLQQGSARVDVAVINGYINGFEIKSAKDTLVRLPRQVELYSTTFDYVTVLSASRHVAAVMTVIPSWWGVIEAKLVNGKIAFDLTRDSLRNSDVDPYSLVQLLWREEALDVLSHLGLDGGIRTKPRRVLWKRLASEVELDTLAAIVRRKLKNRQNWTTAVSLGSYGD